jgi:hypothetical protein
MALMKLLALPTEAELERQSIDFEGFFQEFNALTVAPLTARVTVSGESVNLNGYKINKSPWFTIVDE